MRQPVLRLAPPGATGRFGFAEPTTLRPLAETEAKGIQVLALRPGMIGLGEAAIRSKGDGSNLAFAGDVIVDLGWGRVQALKFNCG